MSDTSVGVLGNRPGAAAKLIAGREEIQDSVPALPER
jgi:hypothetical protein